MAAETKPSPDNPVLAHHRFQEKELADKITRLKAAKAEPGFDNAAAIARAEAKLSEHRKAIKDLTK